MLTGASPQGVCPSVALHVLWDLLNGVTDSGARVRFGSINPNTLQEQCSKHGQSADGSKYPGTHRSMRHRRKRFVASGLKRVAMQRIRWIMPSSLVCRIDASWWMTSHVLRTLFHRMGAPVDS